MTAVRPSSPRTLTIVSPEPWRPRPPCLLPCLAPFLVLTTRDVLCDCTGCGSFSICGEGSGARQRSESTERVGRASWPSEPTERAANRASSQPSEPTERANRATPASEGSEPTERASGGASRCSEPTLRASRARQRCDPAVRPRGASPQSELAKVKASQSSVRHQLRGRRLGSSLSLHHWSSSHGSVLDSAVEYNTQ